MGPFVATHHWPLPIQEWFARDLVKEAGAVGWIEEQFERRLQSQDREHLDKDAAESRFELLASRKWSELVNGLQRDIAEYKELGGEAVFSQLSENEARISNPVAGVTATTISDAEAHTIQYIFDAEQNSIAVPEGGFFSIRRSPAGGADLYSADERVSAEQARRMILEPLLFPNPPRVM
jgi:hypothetical protein